MFTTLKPAIATSFPTRIIYPTPSERLLAVEKATEERKRAGCVFREQTDRAVHAYHVACAAAAAGDEDALSRAGDAYRQDTGELAWVHTSELTRIDAELRFAQSPKCAVVAPAAVKHGMSLRPRAAAGKKA